MQDTSAASTDRMAAERSGWSLPLILLAVAFLLRLPFLGNPVIEGDEQFYLLVGDRLLQGTLPYVEIWDRKPVGLFLIYAAIRALGGEGIVQYQIVATLFAACTAILVARIAATIASPRGAVFAGATYLLWLNVFGGEGGQSPVFYNLPVAGAALLALHAVIRPGEWRRLLGLGAAAMFATGLAMQIKYTAVFEGVYFGCALLLCGWRAGVGPMRLIVLATVWVGCAMLPTLAAMGSYAAMGELQAFLFANFISVFHRNTAVVGSSLGRLATMTGLLLPLAACAVFGLRLARREMVARPDGLRAAGFVAGWAVVAVLGVLVFGTYYNHYALPLLVPLSVAAAPLLGWPGARWRRVSAMLALSLVGVIAATVLTVIHLRARGDGTEVRALASAAALGPGEFLYVFDGETILYFLTRSPLPTPFVFPTHLNDLREAEGIGIDPVAELRRILASGPAYIATTDGTRPRINPEAWAVLSEALRAGYQPVRSVRIGNRNRVLYRRVALPAG